MRASFVAGTDTNVCKTHVCGLLLDFLLKEGVKAGYQKWAATGPEFPPADLKACLRMAGIPFEPGLGGSQVVDSFCPPALSHLRAEPEE